MNGASTTSPSIGWEATADLVVVGSGVAGLTAAYEAQELGLRVVVVTKATMADGNTRWAQGGVAVVLPGHRDAGDSVAAHVADTLTAGAGLCDPAAVRQIIANGPSAVARLIELGATFDSTDGILARAREGGHSAFRIVRAGGDATGAEVERTLVTVARDRSIPVLEHHVAVQAELTASGAVAGLVVLDDRGVPGVVHAPAVLLATGGLGQVYRATSNPDVATADGLALALRAGAVVSDLEFVQFHPTVLYTGSGQRGRCPLVTEAIRGEGAVLVDGAGQRVMTGVHPLADLAPRDVVSAAITRRMASAPGGVADHVFLDATHLSGAAFQARFPTVHASCAKIGVDPAVDPIPVTPAAHFACGGVESTVDGRSSVRGLYVAGEVARTGLHGANRLASNSLLEGLVVGGRVARAVAWDIAAGRLQPGCRVAAAGLPSLTTADRELVQQTMSTHAAIGRDAHGLETAAETIEDALVSRPVWTVADVEDAALALTARALLTAAAGRHESRGCHVRHDHPDRDDTHAPRALRIRLSPLGYPTLIGRPDAVGQPVRVGAGQVEEVA